MIPFFRPSMAPAVPAEAAASCGSDARPLDGALAHQAACHRRRAPLPHAHVQRLHREQDLRHEKHNLQDTRHMLHTLHHGMTRPVSALRASVPVAGTYGKTTSTSPCIRVPSDTRLYKNLQDLLSRVKFCIMDLAAHVSASALRPNRHAHNIPRIPRTRTWPHETRISERASAGSAMAWSMQHEHTCSAQVQAQWYRRSCSRIRSRRRCQPRSQPKSQPQPQPQPTYSASTPYARHNSRAPAGPKIQAPGEATLVATSYFLARWTMGSKAWCIYSASNHRA